jgi:hypothetical protein
MSTATSLPVALEAGDPTAPLGLDTAFELPGEALTLGEQLALPRDPARPRLVPAPRRCTLDAIDFRITAAPDTPPEMLTLRNTILERAALYLAAFLAPLRTPDAHPAEPSYCLCGHPLTGLDGTFTWGLAFGEGFCALCHRPARALHVVRNPDGTELCRFAPLALLYAPAELPSPDGHDAVPARHALDQVLAILPKENSDV